MDAGTIRLGTTQYPHHGRLRPPLALGLHATRLYHLRSPRAAQGSIDGPVGIIFNGDAAGGGVGGGSVIQVPAIEAPGPQVAENPPLAITQTAPLGLPTPIADPTSLTPVPVAEQPGLASVATTQTALNGPQSGMPQISASPRETLVSSVQTIVNTQTISGSYTRVLTSTISTVGTSTIVSTTSEGAILGSAPQPTMTFTPSTASPSSASSTHSTSPPSSSPSSVTSGLKSGTTSSIPPTSSFSSTADPSSTRSIDTSALPSSSSSITPPPPITRSSNILDSRHRIPLYVGVAVGSFILLLGICALVAWLARLRNRRRHQQAAALPWARSSSTESQKHLFGPTGAGGATTMRVWSSPGIDELPEPPYGSSFHQTPMNPHGYGPGLYLDHWQNGGYSTQSPRFDYLPHPSPVHQHTGLGNSSSFNKSPSFAMAEYPSPFNPLSVSSLLTTRRRLPSHMVDKELLSSGTPGSLGARYFTEDETRGSQRLGVRVNERGGREGRGVESSTDGGGGRLDAGATYDQYPTADIPPSLISAYGVSAQLQNHDFGLGVGGGKDEKGRRGALEAIGITPTLTTTAAIITTTHQNANQHIASSGLAPSPLSSSFLGAPHYGDGDDRGSRSRMVDRLRNLKAEGGSPDASDGAAGGGAQWSSTLKSSLVNAFNAVASTMPGAPRMADEGASEGGDPTTKRDQLDGDKPDDSPTPTRDSKLEDNLTRAPSKRLERSAAGSSSGSGSGFSTASRRSCGSAKPWTLEETGDGRGIVHLNLSMETIDGLPTSPSTSSLAVPSPTHASAALLRSGLPTSASASSTVRGSRLRQVFAEGRKDSDDSVVIQPSEVSQIPSTCSSSVISASVYDDTIAGGEDAEDRSLR